MLLVPVVVYLAVVAAAAMGLARMRHWLWLAALAVAGAFVTLAEVQDLDDVRVRQQARDLRLVDEHRDVFAVLRQVRQDALDQGELAVAHADDGTLLHDTGDRRRPAVHRDVDLRLALDDWTYLENQGRITDFSNPSGQAATHVPSAWRSFW